jgi:outer membrane protein TolC
VEQANAAPAPDLRSWWKAFHDPALDRLVDAALTDNLTLAQSVARVEAARQLAGASDLAHLPQVNFHTYAEPTPDSSASYFQFGFDAKWEFGWFGRSTSEHRIAAGTLDAAYADAQSARVSVVAETVKTYLELRGAQQRLTLLDGVANDAQRRGDLVATRVRLRMAAPGELVRAQAQAPLRRLRLPNRAWRSRAAATSLPPCSVAPSPTMRCSAKARSRNSAKAASPARPPISCARVRTSAAPKPTCSNRPANSALRAPIACRGSASAARSPTRRA